MATTWPSCVPRAASAVKRPSASTAPERPCRVQVTAGPATGLPVASKARTRKRVVSPGCEADLGRNDEQFRRRDGRCRGRRRRQPMSRPAEAPGSCPPRRASSCRRGSRAPPRSPGRRGRRRSPPSRRSRRSGRRACWISSLSRIRPAVAPGSTMWNRPLTSVANSLPSATTGEPLPTVPRSSDPAPRAGRGVEREQVRRVVHHVERAAVQRRRGEAVLDGRPPRLVGGRDVAAAAAARRRRRAPSRPSRRSPRRAPRTRYRPARRQRWC